MARNSILNLMVILILSVCQLATDTDVCGVFFLTHPDQSSLTASVRHVAQHPAKMNTTEWESPTPTCSSGLCSNVFVQSQGDE